MGKQYFITFYLNRLTMKLLQSPFLTSYRQMKDKPTGGAGGNTNDGGYIWVG